MNDLSIYKTVRDDMRAGDVIAFGGDPFSKLGPLRYPSISGAIEFLTGSTLSHVAVVFETTLPDSGAERRVVVAESTSLNHKSGVQFNPLSERLAEYDGRAFWLRMSARTWAQLNADAMHAFLKAQDGLAYDFRGIGGFIWRTIPGIGQIPYLHHGAERKFFCSEYVVAGYEAGGLPIGLEPDEVSPQRLAELKIWDRYTQLVGRPGKIARFSTR